MAKPTAARYVRLRAGLVEPQHVQALGGGSPFVLYVWLHLRVKFSGDGAGSTFPTGPYHHDDAALALGAPRTSVRRWFKTLVDAGYITTARGAHGLTVTITKYNTDECPPTDTQDAVRVTTNEHSPEKRVSTSGPVSVHGRPTECPPVAERVSTSEHSIYIDAGATNETSDSSEANVGGAGAPAPAVRGNPNVQAAIDALRAEGMTGVLTPRDRAALKTTDADLGEMARLYAAIFRGEYGDDFMHKNLSVCLCLEKMPGWLSAQEGHQAPAKKNGAASATARIDAVFERALHGHASGSDRRRPQVGAEEVWRGVPRQLPG